MRTLFFSIIMLTFFSIAHAAPCYGTRMPEKNKLHARLEYDNLFKRYLEDNFGKLRSQQEFYGMSYGVFDWLSLDLKAGAGYIKQRPTNTDELDYDSGFAGGYGFRLKCLDKDKLKVVFGFHHISVHPRSSHLGDIKHKAILDDWQVSFLASYKISKATPYLGLRISREDYIHWNQDQRKRITSDRTKSLGLVYGLDIELTQKIWLNIEASAFDAQALSASFNYAF